jgi:hypothetical protein
MDLLPNAEQEAVVDAVARIVERLGHPRAAEPGYVLESAELEAAVREGGFLEVARAEGYGLTDALMVVEALARSPVALEAAASAAVAPGLNLPADLPRPLALIDAASPTPVRYLSPEGSALILTPTEVRLARGADLAVTPANSMYAYPLARPGVDVSRAGEAIGASPTEMRRLWRLALGAEASGLMRAALEVVVEHVKTRRQFGQPLGVFQAIQHRLSECEVVVRGGRLMVLEAAYRGTEEAAAFAALHVQDSIGRLIYETQQFHGAIGLTLEYPLHYWTYRLRMLQGELGGPTGQGLEAAARLWPGERPIAEDFLRDE